MKEFRHYHLLHSFDHRVRLMYNARIVATRKLLCIRLYFREKDKGTLFTDLMEIANAK